MRTVFMRIVSMPGSWLAILQIKFTIKDIGKRKQTHTDVSGDHDEFEKLRTYVTQQGGTEPPFTGRWLKHAAEGTYTCTCCGSDLFLSQSKFDSGTGWPSFTTPASDKAVAEREDLSAGMRRVEVVCKTCQAHLGHVFEDGPSRLPHETGRRYCINSAALGFAQAKPAEESTRVQAQETDGSAHPSQT